MKKLQKLTLKELENSAIVIEDQRSVVAGCSSNDGAGSGPNISRFNPVSLALFYIGTTEVAGAGSNPDIINFFGATSYGTPTDDSTVGWCSAFVNFCVYNSGGVGTNNALASSWLTWGHATSSPQSGDIAIANDGSHVGIVEFVSSNGTVKIVSGNYSNSVAESYVSTTNYSFRSAN